MGLLQIYNVLQPMMKDSASTKTIESIREANFDDHFLQDNQALVLNVSRSNLKNKNFRMNERIFREQMQSFKPEEREDFAGAFRMKQKFQKLQDGKHLHNSMPKSEVVLKANLQRDHSALELAKDNFYLASFEIRQRVQNEVMRL
jgi:hypothetical protein